MSKLDLLFAQNESEQLVTLVYVLLDPERDDLVVANAGHPPPVILRRDLSTEQPPLASGPPLGTTPDTASRSRCPSVAETRSWPSPMAWSNDVTRTSTRAWDACFGPCPSWQGRTSPRRSTT